MPLCSLTEEPEQTNTVSSAYSVGLMKQSTRHYDSQRKKNNKNKNKRP